MLVGVFSPFTTNVQPAVVDPRKVSVSGVGIRPEGVPASLPISFKVDTREAGQSNLDVVVKVRFTQTHRHTDTYRQTDRQTDIQAVSLSGV